MLFYKELEYRWLYINNDKNIYLEMRYFPSIEDLNVLFTKAAGFIPCGMP